MVNKDYLFVSGTDRIHNMHHYHHYTSILIAIMYNRELYVHVYTESTEEKNDITWQKQKNG